MIKTSKSCDLNFANSGRDTEAKTSPRHLNFLKQPNKTTEMLYIYQVLRYIRAPNECPRYCNRANRSHNNQKFGHSLWPHFFFLSPRGGHGRRKILMDSHPYSHETSIFTLGAPHEEGKQNFTQVLNMNCLTFLKFLIFCVAHLPVK